MSCSGIFLAMEETPTQPAAGAASSPKTAAPRAEFPPGAF